MARFYGEVGYGFAAEDANESGIWEDDIYEFPYYGDVIRNTRKLEPGENVNSDILINNSISIVADQYANEHFFAIRYVKWMGTRWKVTNVEVQRPRLILTFGGVYNGT